jgi:hypothetical protein
MNMAYVLAGDDHSNNSPESRTLIRIRLTGGVTVLNPTFDDNATTTRLRATSPRCFR